MAKNRITIEIDVDLGVLGEGAAASMTKAVKDEPQHVLSALAVLLNRKLAKISTFAMEEIP